MNLSKPFAHVLSYPHKNSMTQMLFTNLLLCTMTLNLASLSPVPGWMVGNDLVSIRTQVCLIPFNVAFRNLLIIILSIISL